MTNYELLLEEYTTDLENQVELLKVKVESLEWALANMNKPIVTPWDKTNPYPGGYYPVPPYTVTCKVDK
jgi:hypothetical protein